MGDPICKWRKVSTENIIEMVSWLPKRVCSEGEYKSHMLQHPIGKAFLRTACQLSCQLGLQYVDERKMLHPRFDHDITENEAKEDLPTTILSAATQDRAPLPTGFMDNMNIGNHPTIGSQRSCVRVPLPYPLERSKDAIGCPLPFIGRG